MALTPDERTRLSTVAARRARTGVRVVVLATVVVAQVGAVAGHLVTRRRMTAYRGLER